jgi:hypothetical protein
MKQPKKVTITLVDDRPTVVKPVRVDDSEARERMAKLMRDAKPVRVDDSEARERMGKMMRDAKVMRVKR